MVTSRAAIHPHGPGNGAAQLVRQGAHRYGAPRSQNTATRARRGGESREMKYTAKFLKTPPPQAFFQLYDEEDADKGVLQAALLEPRLQVGVMRHTVVHIVDILPYVQFFDVPVPQMGNQVVEVLQFVDSLVPVAEQVIDVPKIFLEDIPSPLSCREPQLAEQLVEVPTNPGCSPCRPCLEGVFVT